MELDWQVAGVAGATGSVGSELLKVLEGLAWGPPGVLPIARASSKQTSIEWKDQQVGVDVLDEADLESVDLLFVALPGPVSGDIIRRAVDADIWVVDLSGVAWRDEMGPLCVPWLQADRVPEATRVLCVPMAEALLVASVLEPLRRAGIIGSAHAHVLMPASSFGRQGVEELSQQVVALFNAQTPQRKIFPSGIAFDVDPSVSPSADDGWTEREHEVVEQVRGLCAAPEMPLTVSLTQVPVFSGVSVECSIRMDRQVPLELLERVLRDGGVRWAVEGGQTPSARPRSVEGEPFAHGTRLRLNEEGDTLFVWASMDNLRTPAVAAAMCARLLLGRAS